MPVDAEWPQSVFVPAEETIHSWVISTGLSRQCWFLYFMFLCVCCAQPQFGHRNGKFLCPEGPRRPSLGFGAVTAVRALLHTELSTPPTQAGSSPGPIPAVLLQRIPLPKGTSPALNTGRVLLLLCRHNKWQGEIQPRLSRNFPSAQRRSDLPVPSPHVPSTALFAEIMRKK